MKVYISSDIEGTCGICNWAETELNLPDHEYFKLQMTREVSVASQAAIECGATDVLIKDAHDSARNINPEMLPREAKILRGWTKDIYCMMAGINTQKFDAAMMTGYHSAGKENTSPLSHTMTRRLESIKLNGEVISEFVINAYIAGYFNVPVCFISGDKGVCDQAKEYIPQIITAPVQEGIGGATISVNPGVALEMIKNGVSDAFKDDYYKTCVVKMPDSFELELSYVSHIDAYKNSFYPGAIQVNSKKVRFKSTNYMDILRAIHFCVNN